ncbi:reverse transcriptase domain-containing protein [Tanacetum coccineum]
MEVCSLAGGDSQGWNLYTDGASSLKGVGAGLVLIDPFGPKYTYTIGLTFPSTNNEAEYEAQLSELRLARKMKVHTLDVKVDSRACETLQEILNLKHSPKSKLESGCAKQASFGRLQPSDERGIGRGSECKIRGRLGGQHNYGGGKGYLDDPNHKVSRRSNLADRREQS